MQVRAQVLRHPAWALLAAEAAALSRSRPVGVVALHRTDSIAEVPLADFPFRLRPGAPHRLAGPTRPLRRVAAGGSDQVTNHKAQITRHKARVLASTLVTQALLFLVTCDL